MRRLLRLACTALSAAGMRGIASRRWRGGAALGAVAVLAGAGQIFPHPPGNAAGPATDAVAKGPGFHQIFLPDVVVTLPSGLSPLQVARLDKLPGVRRVIAVDGARIKANGREVNLLGVDPQIFRSWTPLRTASDERLWSSLDRHQFVASQHARQLLRLRPGHRYQLLGAAPDDLAFSGSAQLGVAGMDLLVSKRASAGLGLIHNVAALISAPGLAMAALTRHVRAVAGRSSTVTDVRQQELPVDQAASPSKPGSYLELFRESAARYCPGLSWTVLAAIGQIESGDGANPGPSSAGALGPMQFLPSTWQRWGISAFGNSGPPDIMDPYDAVPSAARLLCASGATAPGGLSGAIFAYNHANWYVSEVLGLARQYAQQYG
ncbi:MAG: lytic transglycosylase domain-containing protein [Nocardiopsaceae bacterium]|nr:lytic transglycosylase domain-containing protein [Nocardiopsaceae bacterium]